MWFPNPVALACLTCGQPTVVAETSSGSVRVHCGTWRDDGHDKLPGDGHEAARWRT
jgi:hypothetical protein